MIKKYPDPNHYKPILNRLVGWFGKWCKEEKSGYVETDRDMANSAFWDNNKDQIGFTCDKNVDRKKWKLLKGRMCSVHELPIDDETNDDTATDLAQAILAQAILAQAARR